jgi:HD-GYP domain-containing protein (c-di-GMP phosphodiesterase class II)
MAVADIYDALVTDRPYRKGMPRERAFDIMMTEATKGKLDMRITQILVDMLTSEKQSDAEQGVWH